MNVTVEKPPGISLSHPFRRLDKSITAAIVRLANERHKSIDDKLAQVIRDFWITGVFKVGHVLQRNPMITVEFGLLPSIPNFAL